MAKKKVKSKRKVARKPVAKKVMPMKCGGAHSEMFLMKLSAITFVLFLLTVWPALQDSLMSVHWGWYLGLTIILGFFAMKNCCK